MAINWKVRLKGTGNYDYDDWLEFFRKKISAKTLIESEEALAENLPPDGYAALKRWLEIFEAPSRMDKLYKGRLDKQQEQDIMEIAVGDDDEAFYIALIQKSTKQLESSNVSQQEVARLTQNLDIFRSKLREIRSRKPKAGTTLERVLSAAQAKKPPKKTKSKPTPVKTTVSKAAGASKTKKTGSKSSKSSKQGKVNAKKD